MKPQTKVFSSILVCFVSTFSSAELIQWSISEGGNDHYYNIFLAPSEEISWDDAQIDAVSQGGYLVTLLSATENTFIFDNLVNDSQFWKAGNSPFENQFSGPWIGGFQPDGSSEPVGGWQWVNNDGTFDSTYTNWDSGEPNNFGAGESRTGFFDNNNSDPPTITPFWNDVPETSTFPSYVVEFDTNPIPEPSTYVLFLTVMIGGIVIRRKRRQA